MNRQRYTAMAVLLAVTVIAVASASASPGPEQHPMPLLRGREPVAVSQPVTTKKGERS